MKSIDFQITYELSKIDDVVQQLLDAGITNYTVVAMVGDLGSGKTTLIQSLCKKLGVNDNISSPTFSIINEYKGQNGHLYHIDLYRLKDFHEALDIGIEDYLFSGNICFIEWPQLIIDLLPTPYLKIEIENLGNFTRTLRAYTITSTS